MDAPLPANTADIPSPALLILWDRVEENLRRMIALAPDPAFAGIGLSVGCEKYISPKYTVKTEVKMNSYTGPSQATASEINILAGLVLGF